METTRSILLFIAAMAGLVIFIFGLISFLFLFFRAINKIFYKRAGLNRGIVLLISLLAAVGFFLLVNGFLLPFITESWIRYIVSYIIACLLFYGIAPGLLFLYTYKASSKGSLAAGARKMKYNYMLFSTVCFLIAAIFLFLLIYTLVKEPGNISSKIYSPMFFAFIACGIMYRRMPAIYKAQAKDLTELTAKPFVLFLREFRKEQHPFYYGKYLDEFGATQQRIQAQYTNFNLATITFETYFSLQVERYLGHLVGLGNPQDLFPHETAKLIYKIGDWKTDLAFLVQSSKCIIMMSSLSASIRFELSELLRLNCASKLYFFTRPRRKAILTSYFGWLFDFATYPQPLRWSEFQNILIEAGFRSSVSPGLGAVIGFTADNEAVLLKEDCRLPSEYIIAIKDDLAAKANHQETHKNVILPTSAGSVKS